MTRRRLMVDPSELAIIVIDVQPYFLDGWMTGASEPLLARLEFLLALATVYDLPLLATFEQPIEKKGWLPERLEPFFPAHGQRHTKQTFNCCGEASIVEAIAGLGRSQIALAGAETDVCVLQSTLGLIEAGKQVFLLEDALFSSEPHVGPALRRMEQAGAIPSTVKALSYELRRSVATPPPEQVFAQHAPGLTLPEPETFPVWASQFGS
ncbi:MAG: isochorismatase family protein [Chloroflexia bacterium]|nr:isochorismatase family protein [Chloroflexia bacterium]